MLTGTPQSSWHTACDLPWPGGREVLLVYARAADWWGAEPMELSPEELRRAADFTREPVRLEYIAARRFVRHTLGNWLNLAPSALQFAAGARGKPVLHGPQGRFARFNLSHKGGWLLLALCAGHDVGVDLEETAPVRGRDVCALARRYFHPEEVQWLSGRPVAGQAADFARLWTGKEAILKLRGDGLQGGLAEFNLTTFANQGAWQGLPGQHPAQLRSCPAPQGLTATFAVSGNETCNWSAVTLINTL